MILYMPAHYHGITVTIIPDHQSPIKYAGQAKAFGQLVQLGFDVAVFTPAAYRRPRLGRPSMEFSSCGRLRT